MGIEKPETSLASLIIPLPQVRAWAGFLRTACTSNTGMGFMYFTKTFFRLYFLSQVLPGNLLSVLHQRSESSSNGGSQIHVELAIHKLG